MKASELLRLLEENGRSDDRDNIDVLKKSMLEHGDFNVTFAVATLGLTQDPRAAKGIAEAELRRRNRKPIA